MNVLFVCTTGLNRSRTAAEMWKEKHPDDEVKFSRIADLSKEIINWADKIIVFEEKHRKAVMLTVESSAITYSKIDLWAIEDIYDYNDKELVEVLLKSISKG